MRPTSGPSYSFNTAYGECLRPSSDRLPRFRKWCCGPIDPRFGSMNLSCSSAPRPGTVHMFEGLSLRLKVCLLWSGSVPSFEGLSSRLKASKILAPHAIQGRINVASNLLYALIILMRYEISTTRLHG